MRAIFLIAGTGTRLKPLTETVHKCLTEVNGVKIFDNALNALKEKGVEEVVLVTGYLHQSIVDHVEAHWSEGFNFSYVYSKDYATTNNIYSLWLAKEYFDQPFLLIEGDVFFEKNILIETALSNESLWFGDSFIKWRDGCRLEVTESNKVSKIEIIRDTNVESDNRHFKSVGMMYYAGDSKLLKDNLEEEIRTNNINVYYDLFFAKYIDLFDIYIKNIEGLKWFEIDTLEDLQLAETLFEE